MYEIHSKKDSLHNIKLRGRIRYFAIENTINCLVENATDTENIVRFALPVNSNPKQITDFIYRLMPELEITTSLCNVPNPVLSKLKVNDLSRYKI
ncbi:hypothetical protein IT408_03455 [Candidatus Uhrbacteria bacterium]|nr:hypothetical protein [Candidatus Uhrbacteria bacterium]